MRKAALTTQGVSLKFLAIISFKFTYVCFSLISSSTCCGGFWQQCCGGWGVLSDRLHIPWSLKRGFFP